MDGFSGPVVAIVALALLWLGIAVAIAFIAARRFALAQQVLAAAQSNARLARTYSVAAARVCAQTDGSKPMRSWYASSAFELAPGRLAELSGNDSGIVPDDLNGLIDEVEAARASAGRISRKVRANGSGRVFEVRGGPAPSPEPAGTLLLWFFDTSAGEEERSKLALAAAPDRRRAQFAHSPDRGGAFPDVVPRPGPQARPRQQRVRRRGRRRRRRRRHRALPGAHRRRRRGQRHRQRAQGAGDEPHRLAHAAGDHPRRAANAADRQRAAVDRRGRRLRGRRPGPRGRADRAHAPHGIAARARRPNDRRARRCSMPTAA